VRTQGFPLIEAEPETTGGQRAAQAEASVEIAEDAELFGSVMGAGV
jgi:hypothetical protein